MVPAPTDRPLPKTKWFEVITEKRQGLPLFMGLSGIRSYLIKHP
jgi:hypothetical protein